ncbi:hypothetical protein ABPG75_009109 [Micractinium tetrahymenae]
MAEAAARRSRVAAAAAMAVVVGAAIAGLVLSGSMPPGLWLRLPIGQQPLRLQPKQAGSLLTPAQLAKWRQFAAARQCSLAEADYAQIFSDLAPFRRAGGISEADVAAAAAALPAATAVLTVRGGRTMDEGEAADEEAAEEEAAAARQGGSGQQQQRQRQQQQQQARPRRRLPWGGLGYYRRLMADFEADLPDMKLLFNFGDRPRSWTAPLPPADEAALQADALSVQATWERHGCDAAVGAGLRRKHGLFQGGPFWGRRGPLPVLSGWRVEGCFSADAVLPRTALSNCSLQLLSPACLPAFLPLPTDILVPHAWNNKGKVSQLTLSSGCPLSGEAWQNKSDVAFWRGSSTGAHVDSSMPPEVWQGFQRQRLVALSGAHPDLLDAAFTRFTQCDPPACAAMEALYGRAPFANASQLFSHKLTVVVDGNGAAARLGPTLCSGSVALNAQLFHEWFFFRLQPFRHYIPIRPDYEDLLERIRWARQHDADTEQIAATAVRFVNTQLRTEDLQCYLYRLMLEYGALYRPGKPGNAGPGGSTGGSNGTAAARARAAARDRPP